MYNGGYQWAENYTEMFLILLGFNILGYWGNWDEVN
jgi:hypothetical protein